MTITLADSAGFCFGVKRAVDTVYHLLEDKEKKYILWARLFTTNR